MLHLNTPPFSKYFREGLTESSQAVAQHKPLEDSDKVQTVISRVVLDIDVRYQRIQQGRRLLDAVTLQAGFNNAEAPQDVIKYHSDVIVVTHLTRSQSLTIEGINSFLNLFEKGTRLGFIDTAREAGLPLTKMDKAGQKTSREAFSSMLPLHPREIPHANSERCLTMAVSIFKAMRQHEQTNLGVIRPQFVVFLSDAMSHKGLFDQTDPTHLMTANSPIFETSMVPIFISLGKTESTQMAQAARALNGFYRASTDLAGAFNQMALYSLNQVKLTDCVSLTLKSATKFEVFDDLTKLTGSQKSREQVAGARQCLDQVATATVAPLSVGGTATFFVQTEIQDDSYFSLPTIVADLVTTNVIVADGYNIKFALRGRPEVLATGQSPIDSLESSSAKNAFCFHFMGSSIPVQMRDLSVPSMELSPNFFAAQPVTHFEKRVIVSHIEASTGFPRLVAEVVLSFLVGKRS